MNSGDEFTTYGHPLDAEFQRCFGLRLSFASCWQHQNVMSENGSYSVLEIVVSGVLPVLWLIPIIESVLQIVQKIAAGQEVAAQE